MQPAEEITWPKIPSYIVTAIVVALSTLVSTYVTQKVNTQIDTQQQALIERIDERLRVVEISRFTRDDGDRMIETLEKEVKRLSDRIDRLEEKVN